MKNNLKPIFLTSLLIASGMFGCGSDSDSGNPETPQSCQISQAECTLEGKTLNIEKCICVDSGTPVQNCPLTEAMCASANKTLDDANCVCVDSQPPQGCKITQADCESQGKTLDDANCVCVDSQPPQECKTDGLVKCDGTCIDPKTSNIYCGANENCENYTSCKDTETCTEGRCRPTKCESDEHFYDVICEKDSLENCGEHGLKCANTVAGWKSGACTQGRCEVLQCIDGFHVDANTGKCVQDTNTCCGASCTKCTSEEYCISATCATTGTVVTFGNYYQSNATTKEPIQWRILEIDSERNQMLLLSEYVLDVQPYHTSKTSITWEDCSLRTWLNNTFMATAFSATEQAKIQTTHLDNQANPYIHTSVPVSGGNATDDKVFLLGVEDVCGEDSNSVLDYYCSGSLYFNNGTDRRALATWYVFNLGTYAYSADPDNPEEIGPKCDETNIQMEKCFTYWWLRSPGSSNSDAVYVHPHGFVEFGGDDVNFAHNGVRPALWVQY